MSTRKQPILISICGPTAVGKTAMAIALAQQWRTEVISFDSRQFYRELQIGAAPPNPAQLAQVPHHFIGHRSITEPWQAGDFEKAALQKIDRLFQKHRLLVLVGGSGLYLKALAEGLDSLPPVSDTIRQKWRQAYRQKGLSYLQQQVQTMDPQYYKEVDIQNPMRLLRALEVTESSGQPYSSFRKGTVTQRPFQMVKIGLNMPRNDLYKRINQRTLQMVSQGLAEEARGLYPYRYLSTLQTVGYREFFAHFEGHLNQKETLTEIQKNTRRYAKRQLTWFRKDSNVIWFEPHQKDNLIHWLQKHLKSKSI